jgi:hypothetical protein
VDCFHEAANRGEQRDFVSMVTDTSCIKCKEFSSFSASSVFVAVSYRNFIISSGDSSLLVQQAG